MSAAGERRYRKASPLWTCIGLCSPPPGARTSCMPGVRKFTRGAVAGHAFAEDKTVVPVASCNCLLYTSPSPRDRTRSRMPSSA